MRNIRRVKETIIKTKFIKKTYKKHIVMNFETRFISFLLLLLLNFFSF